MRYLIDTHILIWQAQDSVRLLPAARALLHDPRNILVFSVVSLWEIVIKNTISQGGFSVNPVALRDGLLRSGYRELAVEAEHVLEVGRLEPLHNDPFDRLLLAQARTEGLALLTVDKAVLAYGFPAIPAY